MRIRSVKPCFFKDEELADLGPYAALLFEGLWCMSDRDGRLEDRPRYIKSEILPYYDVDCEDLLNQLHEHGFILRYEAEGKRCIHVVKFREHQRITGKEAETASTLPAPPTEKQPEPERETTGKQSGNTRDDRNKEGEGDREGEGLSPNQELVPPKKERPKPNLAKAGASPLWLEWLEIYPKRDGDRKCATGEQKFKALLKSGVKYEDLLSGVKRYRAWCDATGKTKTSLVQQITTWLNGRAWLEPWDIPEPEPGRHKSGTAPRFIDPAQVDFTGVAG